MTKIRTILFDLDGVLVEAKDWHFEAFNKALLAFGYEPVMRSEHLRKYDGLPTRKKLLLLSENQPIPPEQFEEINAMKQRFTMHISKEKCVPDPIHIQTINALKQDGFQMAVCSNSVRASVNLLLEKTGLKPFFEFTLSNEDVTNPKPHPEIYMTAMKRFGSQPAETLILEDNVNGLRAAHAAGAHVMEIKDSSHVTYERILEAIAHFESTGHAASH